MMVEARKSKPVHEVVRFFEGVTRVFTAGIIPTVLLKKHLYKDEFRRISGQFMGAKIISHHDVATVYKSFKERISCMDKCCAWACNKAVAPFTINSQDRYVSPLFFQEAEVRGAIHSKAFSEHYFSEFVKPYPAPPDYFERYQGIAIYNVTTCKSIVSSVIRTATEAEAEYLALLEIPTLGLFVSNVVAAVTDTALGHCGLEDGNVLKEGARLAIGTCVAAGTAVAFGEVASKAVLSYLAYRTLWGAVRCANNIVSLVRNRMNSQDSTSSRLKGIQFDS